jgi:glutathione synthase/RimK-type ligase-like ATP-grasp enzyme
MAGSGAVSSTVAAAIRVAPLESRAAASAAHAMAEAAHEVVHAAQSVPEHPRLVIVGIGRTPPKTTQSLIESAVRRGLEPGHDVIATRYRDLQVGVDPSVVKLGPGTGADGLVLAGSGQRALFLFRGGGNLTNGHLRTIGAVQAVDGAVALTDLSFIQRAGSKATTFDVLDRAGLALANTITVQQEKEAMKAFNHITATSGEDVAVLKKVNSLGGKDVHFIREHNQISDVMARDTKATFVMQEFLPHAKDQDVRVHLVWNHQKRDFEVANAYVRNRNAFQPTPNLANGGFPTGYILSPWEQDQAIRAARALAEGSPHAPLHVGLDFFPRSPITATTVERNAALQEQVASGVLSREAAARASSNTVVIGEAASSAGTKGTELVLGEGVNPVVDRMVDEILHIRSHGVSPLPVRDALQGVAHLRA